MQRQGSVPAVSSNVAATSEATTSYPMRPPIPRLQPVFNVVPSKGEIGRVCPRGARPAVHVEIGVPSSTPM
jgi:hypothetical protein